MKAEHSGEKMKSSSSHHHPHHPPQKGTTTSSSSSSSSWLPKWHVITTLSNFFLFGCGLAAGVILNSFLKDASLDLHVTQFSISPSPASSPPPFQPTTTGGDQLQLGKLDRVVCDHYDKQQQQQKTNDHEKVSSLSLVPRPPLPPAGRVGLREYLKVPAVMHDMEEEELLWRASAAPKLQNYPFQRVPKVAFLFLTKGPILLHQIWEMFFKGVDQGLFSIYVHSDPSYVQPPDESPVFRGRRIPSKIVEWGKVNMMEAERRLLANALLDISNQRFVLLSESCIPLFNFSTVYAYLVNSRQVYVEAYYSSAARNRYTYDMLPEVKLSHWKKGSQWFEMDRDLAVEVVADRKYFTKFQKHCKNQSCYVDEHYLPTYFSIQHWRRNSNRSLTWVDWSNGGIHPNRYVRAEVTPEFLEKLRSGGGRCMYNGRSTSTCHLFARKFLVTSLIRLLRYAPKVMHFNP